MTKKIKKAKKLSLNKRTLRELDAPSMDRVVGGQAYATYTCTATAECEPPPDTQLCGVQVPTFKTVVAQSGRCY